MSDTTADDNQLRSRFDNEGQEGYSEQHGSDYDSDVSSDEPLKDQKRKNHKPGDNAFRQQRLRAINPVMSVKTVLPILFTIAVVFVPLGAAMWYAAYRVQDLTIEYTQCERLASKDYWSEVPREYLNFNFHTNKGDVNKEKVSWKLSTDDSQPFSDERLVCNIQMEVPKKFGTPLLFYYRLNKFYPNHRRYVGSYSEDQIIGQAASRNTIKNTPGQNCEPLSTNHEGKKIYPCGLIANSLFNDTFSTTLIGVNGTSNDYKLTDKGIAWSSDKNRFKKTKYHYSDVVPPPNWYKSFPNGYNETNLPDISTWYQFQNWMHPSGLPTFNKLALRNDNDALEPGIYEVSIGLHFPVLPFNGNKYIYLSERSAIGGKNYFIGISWIVAGGICFVLGFSLLVVHVFKSRKVGDVNMLSWNKEAYERDEKLRESTSPSEK